MLLEHARVFPLLSTIRVFESLRTLLAAPRHPGTDWGRSPPLDCLTLWVLPDPLPQYG